MLTTVTIKVAAGHVVAIAVVHLQAFAAIVQPSDTAASSSSNDGQTVSAVVQYPLTSEY